MYDEPNVIIVLTEQADLNVKHGKIFADYWKQRISEKETVNETRTDQSKQTRTFESNREIKHLNNKDRNAEFQLSKHKVDKQLQTAVSYLLRQLKKDPKKLPALPKYPNKSVKAFRKRMKKWQAQPAPRK